MKAIAARILVIDDEPQITRVLRTTLTAHGFDVRTANEPEEGLRVFCDWTPALVISDLVMPGMSGVEVCCAIRSSSSVPILILSVSNRESDKVEALDAGADDYVIKPFSTPELISRIRARLRRAPERGAEIISQGDLNMDLSSRRVVLNGKTIRLTPKEFNLLLHLARNAGKVSSHSTLITAVWGEDATYQPDYLRVFIGQLRKKLEAATGKQYIETEPYLGYRFVAEGVRKSG